MTAGVLVTITETKGSVPREAGTHMWVGADTSFGTIGGGRLEHQAMEQARKMMADPATDRATQKYALGPLLEQCCGGSVVLGLEKMTEADARKLMTPLHRGTPLYIFGAGHVGRAVVRALAPLPFDIHWIDSRAAEFPGDSLANCCMHVTDDALAYVHHADPGSLFLVFTHTHQLDFAITAEVLKRGDATYCGLIGSKTKRARFENKMLRGRVITEADLPHLTCPIGMPGITGKEPEIIAASVVAQLLTMIS